MEVIKITEHEDGSATLDIDMSEKEMNFFIEYAVVDILKKQIERVEDEHRSNGNNGEIQSK